MVISNEIGFDSDTRTKNVTIDPPVSRTKVEIIWLSLWRARVYLNVNFSDKSCELYLPTLFERNPRLNGL